MYLITGANGQLGTELSNRLPKGSAYLTDVNDLNITNYNDIERFFNRHRDISVIINCAAYTNVDLAESDIEKAYDLNLCGPKCLALMNKPIIHISTDYVFDGSLRRPLTPRDFTNPQTVYGKSKLRGEWAVLHSAPSAIVIRTAWLYSPYGKNFVKTMQKLGAEKDEINVVSDQHGTPTYAGDLADAILKILPYMESRRFRKLYHYTNMGQCTWYDFAVKIMEMSGLKCKVNPISTEQYPTPAKRPAYSVLDKSDIQYDFGLKIPTWQDGLARCLKKMKELSK